MDNLEKEFEKQKKIVQEANDRNKKRKQQIKSLSGTVTNSPEYQELFGELEEQIQLQFKKIKRAALLREEEYEALFSELEADIKKQLKRIHSLDSRKEYELLFGDLEKELVRQLIDNAKSATDAYKELFGDLEKEHDKQIKKWNDHIDLFQKEYDDLFGEIEKQIQAHLSKVKPIRDSSEYDELFGDLEKELRKQIQKVIDKENRHKKEYDDLFADLEDTLQKQLQHIREVIDGFKKDYDDLFGELEKTLAEHMKTLREIEEVEEIEEELSKKIDEEPCIHRVALSGNTNGVRGNPCVKEAKKPRPPPCKKAETKCKSDGTSWGHTIVDDLKKKNTPDWGAFLGKLVPPNVKVALALLDVFQVVAKNKDAIVDTGKKVVESTIKKAQKGFKKEEEEEKGEKKDGEDEAKDDEKKEEKEDEDETKEEEKKEEEKKEDKNVKGGKINVFTYEDCVF